MNRLIKYLAILGVILTAAGFCLAAGAKAYGAGNGSIRFWKDWGQETVFPWEHSAGGDEWRHDFRHHDSWWQEFSRDSFWRDLEEDWEAEDREAEDRDAEGRGPEDWNSETDWATEADRKHFSQVKEMDLQIGGGTLTIKTGEESGDSIQVSCKDWASRKDWYQVSCEDGTLEVEVKGKSGRHPEVEIIVPADYALEEASIHMAAGSCRIAALDAAELEVDCAAGEVDIQNGSAGEASFQCSAGKIIYQGQIHGAAEGDCSAGSIHLKLLQDEKDFNYSVNGGGGAVTVGGWSVSGAVLRQEINNGAEQDMELDCVAGNIQVEFSKNEG